VTVFSRQLSRKRKSFSKRITKCVRVSLAGTLFAISWIAGASADEPIVGKAQSFSISVPVHELPPTEGGEVTVVPRRINPLAGEPDGGKRGTWSRQEPPIDPLISRLYNPQGETPAPDLVFDGLSNPSACRGCAPPAAVGDIGTKHFVQMVNKTKVGIFRKANGVAAMPAFNFGRLWTTGPCTNGRGDPVVLFDSLANRWLLSQSAGQRHLCFAISRSDNPMGVYRLYTFNVGELPDSFKVGVWSNGYYVSANEKTYTAYAFDRAKMLAGDPSAGFVKFTGQTNFLMPADVDGGSAPDGGGLFYTFKDNEFHGGRDRIELFELVPNFVTPTNSRFRLKEKFPVARFTYTVCGFFNMNCVRQKGTVQRVDAVSEWPMHRFAYRRIGGRESLVGNFTVGGGKGAVGAAIRWFELRNTGGRWRLFQLGTHDLNDGLDRFMGSIAMDKDGNIALGYSTSSNTQFPSIRYATRAAEDRVGTLGPERILKAGGGSQTGPNRWGESSAMTVDPVVGCQFWYTNEYYKASSPSNWKTAAGAFRVSTCTPQSGFPDASNTGVPPGVTLKDSGPITSTHAGQVIERVRVNGSVRIRHDNVILRQCEVIGNAVFIDANNVTVEDCTIRPGSGWNSGIGVYRTGNTIRRNNISHTENGISIGAHTAGAMSSGHLIEDNYIHDLHFPSADPHIDGIQLFGDEVRDVIIRHNTIIMDTTDDNGAIVMGAVQNVQIDNNRLHGAGYTIHVDGRHGTSIVSGISITNNRFGPFVFGRMTFERAHPFVSGNVDDATGRPVGR
jgi:hypothetical protein